MTRKVDEAHKPKWVQAAARRGGPTIPRPKKINKPYSPMVRSLLPHEFRLLSFQHSHYLGLTVLCLRNSDYNDMDITPPS